MERYEGGCSCGDLRVIANGPPKSVGICHCMECRKHHGAVFYAAAAFPQAAVEITGAATSYKERYFCPRCGSSVFARSDGEVELHLGALDAPNRLTPTYELWTSRREAWLPPFAQMDSYPKDRPPSDE